MGIFLDEKYLHDSRFFDRTITLILAGFFLLTSASCQPDKHDQLPSGDPKNGGLILPEGFEAVVVSDSVGPARHLVVNENGDIYVKLKRAYETGGIAALRDTSGDGKADIIKTFSLDQTRGNYETGMEIHDGYLYYSTHLYVYRYPLIPGELVPDTTRRDTLVIDDHTPGHHEHIGKPLSFDNAGNMYTAYGAPSDACQEQNRIPGSPGQDPCPILENHAGIWKYQADQYNQVQEESSNAESNSTLHPIGVKYASGLRSIVAMDWNPVDNELYVVQHGRDNLHSMWPAIYSPWDNAVLPAEEFGKVTEGSNFGWPYCFYDQFQEKKILAPEYGGDGEMIGRCNEFDDPVVGFPGHFAPNDLKFYQGDQFPEYYRNGAFIAFHGSTIRNPYPQAGYFVSFVPYSNGDFSDEWDVFANGFTVVDPVVNTNDSNYRPVGLAVGPDGSLYISDSVDGKIWRVMFKGDKNSFGEEQLAGMKEVKKTANNIRYPDEVEDDLQQEEPVVGQAVYELYCAACHQRNGEGVAGRFPSLKGSEKVQDQSSLLRVILAGQDTPNFEILMPPHNFLDDDEIAGLSTYIMQEFGNEADSITSDQVERIREVLN